MGRFLCFIFAFICGVCEVYFSKLPMKTPLPLVFPAVCLLFGFFSPSALHADETAVWLAENAKVSSAGILLPDDTGAFDLEMKDATGVTIGEKPPGGNLRAREGHPLQRPQPAAHSR